MKLSEHWASYVSYTAGFSEAARTTSFAGIAVCWLLAGERFDFTLILLCALASFVAFLALDILQFLQAAVVYRLWLRRTERRIQKQRGKLEDEEVAKPSAIDAPAFTLFVAKAIALVTGYGLLAVEFGWRLWTAGSGGMAPG